MRENEKVEAYLRQAQEIADIGSWHLDIPTGNLLWSEEGYRIFGIAQGEEMTYERFLEQVHPEDREFVEKSWEAALEGEEYDIEHRIVVDEKIKWVRERAEFEFDEEGNPVEGIGVVQDITDQKHRLKELRGFRKAVEAAGHSIYITDPKGSIEYANPTFEETTGFSRKEAIGKTPRILKSGEHSEDFYEDLWKTILSGEVWEGEVINETKSGDLYAIAQTIAPVQDEDGHIERFVAVNTDISERKRTEQKLRRRSRALEEAPIGILITDPDQEDNPLIYVNKATEAITEYSKDELIGENARILQGDQTDPQKTEKLRKAIDNAEETSAEIRNYRKDGTEFWSKIAIAPVRDENGTVINWVGFQEDVTERRQRTTQLGVMNRVLRHNLRNDMNVINGRANLLNESASPEDEGDLKTIIDTSDALINMAKQGQEITSLLQEPPMRKEVDLEKRVQSIVSNIAAEYPEADLTVTSQGDTIASPSTEIDSAIQELISNAIIHNDQETPEVTIQLTEKGQAVEIEVRDNGPTLAQSERGLLLGDEPSQLKHGSGLGLWLVNIIATRSGGSISYGKNSSRGNTIRLRLP